jgi:hypothetical protein
MSDPVALESFLGARIDGAHFCTATGLVVLSLYAGEHTLLGVGIGPRITGVGVLPRLPKGRAAATHPLVAAMRAHVVDHRVRHVTVADGALWIVAGGAEVTARVGLHPGRRGAAVVIAATGSTVARWPAEEPVTTAWEIPGDLHANGARMLDTNDRAVFELERASVVRSVTRHRTSLARRIEAIRGDLARLDQVARLQKIGRLLLAQGAKIPRGAREAQLDDWEEGGTLTVTLDPARPAKPQAEDFFARAKRLQRGETVMKRRLEDALQMAERVEQAQNSLESVTDSEALQTAIAAVRAAGVPVHTDSGGASPGAREKRGARLPFHKYAGARGHAILVGRGARDNDALTTRYSRPHDLWLHTKGITGAHVVVPLEKGTSCPPDVLADAAMLAVHFSDARGEAVCDVSYVERRYVRKPRGSAPGAVTYDHEKVIAVRVDPARVEQLLATREEP